MLRIGQISNFSNISIKTLRYYDRIGLFKPMYIDPSTNYRYYDETQINKLNMIIDLKMIGLSLHDIVRVMKNSFDKLLLLDLLSKRRKQCEDNIKFEELKIENINTITEKIQQHDKLNNYLVAEKEIYDEKLERLISLDSADSAERHAIEEAIWL
ncbi:MerR family transcriptional regulator [Clostridium oryzae]|uniref:Multidrug-efflux transporter 1 regulator n=1 Tax=Clostridium oryzae TaxID=1450648 RepID=A0A1V4ITT8_9CLOT|nr:MerR family transcriptional regulator [Clostridium oryzae]OPJ62877.1 multidrug-efflux transporter 1 regulator [Clostridium oryzae]